MSGSPGLDSRLIPLFLSLGWLLVTLGIWGACGRWWVWPLAVGVGLLATGAAYGWAMWRQILAGAGGPRTKGQFEPPFHEPSTERRSA